MASETIGTARVDIVVNTDQFDIAVHSHHRVGGLGRDSQGIMDGPEQCANTAPSRLHHLAAPQTTIT